jgi:hypothetical protein
VTECRNYAFVYRILGAPLVGYYEAKDAKNERFLYVSQMPVDYYGRSINQDAVKKYEFLYAVLIVVAKEGKAPFILNIFPADNGYYEKQAELK